MRLIPSLRTALFAFTLFIISTASFAQIGISVTFGPPAIPVYEQPVCPGDGYLWTPGYWAWDPDAADYYWVPGTWVEAPEVGYLWTPPWWGWEGGRFFFHEGWWGPHIGFYGGINYGFGYFGDGFVGGRWDHDHFFYNRSVMNVNVVNIRNVYNEHVEIRTENHVSFNGGPGGIEARARPEEERAEHERHIGPAGVQAEHLRAARGNPELRASANHGRPPIAATGRPGEFRGGAVIAAREAGGAYRPPENRGGAQPRPESGSRTFNHASELPPMQRGAAPNTGNQKRDQKYQQQQEKLFNKQNQERQQLQQRQEQEHQRLAQQNANEARKQQTEQRHQQQTQQLQQRHEQQQQHLQTRQQPPPKHK
jgi:WXXGXW repeat (2 copies)